VCSSDLKLDSLFSEDILDCLLFDLAQNGGCQGSEELVLQLSNH
jgi:hypothetical protein